MFLDHIITKKLIKINPAKNNWTNSFCLHFVLMKTKYYLVFISTTGYCSPCCIESAHCTVCSTQILCVNRLLDTITMKKEKATELYILCETLVWPRLFCSHWTVRLDYICIFNTFDWLVEKLSSLYSGGTVSHDNTTGLSYQWQIR